LLLRADATLIFAAHLIAMRPCVSHFAAKICFLAARQRQQLPSIETPLKQERVDPIEISPSSHTQRKPLRSRAHAHAGNIHAFVIERLRALIVELPTM
jgi:hypothetical protein